MPKSIKVFKYDLSGKFLAEYSSINEAAKQNDCNFSGVRHCVMGKYSQSGGYIWSNKKQKKVPPPANSRYEKMRHRFIRIKAAQKGRVFNFESISEAAKFIGCHRSAISQIINNSGNLRTIKGWKVSKLL